MRIREFHVSSVPDLSHGISSVQGHGEICVAIIGVGSFVHLTR